jgi:hypothetical protein
MNVGRLTNVYGCQLAKGLLMKFRPSVWMDVGIIVGLIDEYKNNASPQARSSSILQHIFTLVLIVEQFTSFFITVSLISTN